MVSDFGWLGKYHYSLKMIRGGWKMADFITIVFAILAIVLIMKIAAKVIKFALTIAVIGIVIYILTNYGFLRGVF